MPVRNPSLEIDITTFDCTDIGANTVILTVTDNNGNVATCNATVTVEDNVTQQLFARTSPFSWMLPEMPRITADAVNNGSSDACAESHLDIDITTFDCAESAPTP